MYNPAPYRWVSKCHMSPVSWFEEARITEVWIIKPSSRIHYKLYIRPQNGWTALTEDSFAKFF